MPVIVPTKPHEVVYRDKNGNEFPVKDLSDGDLMVALHDMLHRKAKHNHKMNKMFTVAETLSTVVKAIHAEKARRINPGKLTPYYEMQILADQGRLIFKSPETDITIEDDE